MLAARRAYNANGNLETVTDPLSNVTTYTYTYTSGQVQTITDPRGKVTTYTYNANGNLETITDPLSDVTIRQCPASGMRESVSAGSAMLRSLIRSGAFIPGPTYKP